jgi:hypothetical protein
MINGAVSERVIGAEAAGKSLESISQPPQSAADSNLTTPSDLGFISFRILFNWRENV